MRLDSSECIRRMRCSVYLLCRHCDYELNSLRNRQPVKRLKRRASNEQALQHDASQRYLDSGWWKSLQRARLNYNNPALYPRCCRPAFWRRWVEVVVGCAGAPRYDSSCRLCIPVQRGWSSNVADHAEQLQLRRQRQISVRRCVECLWYVTWLARLGLISHAPTRQLYPIIQRFELTQDRPGQSACETQFGSWRNVEFCLYKLSSC